MSDARSIDASQKRSRCEELQGTCCLAEIAPDDSRRVRRHAWISEGRTLRTDGQLRRSAASIGANIAEGSGRRSNNEICRFLQIARGSASEAEYHILLAHDLKLLCDDNFRRLSRQADELQRMLTALIQSFHREEREVS